MASKDSSSISSKTLSPRCTSSSLVRVKRIKDADHAGIVRVQHFNLIVIRIFSCEPSNEINALRYLLSVSNFQS
jgi:hypothetical protein